MDICGIFVLSFLIILIMSVEHCKDWNPLIENGVTPKVLLIGHDPRLQSSETIADYALFSNYYFLTLTP